MCHLLPSHGILTETRETWKSKTSPGGYDRRVAQLLGVSEDHKGIGLDVPRAAEA